MDTIFVGFFFISEAFERGIDLPPHPPPDSPLLTYGNCRKLDFFLIWHVPVRKILQIGNILFFFDPGDKNLQAWNAGVEGGDRGGIRGGGEGEWDGLFVTIFYIVSIIFKSLYQAILSQVKN